MWGMFHPVGLAQTPDPKTQQPTSRPSPTFHLSPILFQAEGGKVKRIEQLDLKELFHFAAQFFQKKDYATAIRLYQRILKYAWKHPYEYAAMYNLALAYEHSKQHKLAVQTYQAFVKSYPDKVKDIRHARFRMASCYEELKLWRDAFAVYDQLLQQDLNQDDRVDALAAAGRAMFHLRRPAQARPLLRLAIRLHTTYVPQTGNVPTKIREAPAMAQYYLARIHDLEFRSRHFRTPAAQMKEDLEYKAKHLMLAQNLYFGTIPLRHADWSLAALYRIGEMYEQMYQDIMKAPVPEDLKPHEVKVYQQALRNKIRVLLEKALLAYRHNLLLAQRIGIADSRWYTLTQQRFQALLDFTVRVFGRSSTSQPTSRPTSAQQPPKPSSVPPATTRPVLRSTP